MYFIHTVYGRATNHRLTFLQIFQRILSAPYQIQKKLTEITGFSVKINPVLSWFEINKFL
jgi:hypothetical protein